MNPLLEPDKQLAPEDIRFRFRYTPSLTLEVAQQQMHAIGRSISLFSITGASRLLFVGLPRSDKLGEYLEAEGKLVPTS